ncbi:MAG TPA: hypothetical protein VF177_09895 [Anaerolineae bacterium]
MHVRCPYCRQSFTLNRDFVAQAVAEAVEKGQKHYAVECVNCRKTIKVSVAQMKRFVPAAPPAEGSESVNSEQ